MIFFTTLNRSFSLIICVHQISLRFQSRTSNKDFVFWLIPEAIWSRIFMSWHLFAQIWRLSHKIKYVIDKTRILVLTLANLNFQSHAECVCAILKIFSYTKQNTFELLFGWTHSRKCSIHFIVNSIQFNSHTQSHSHLRPENSYDVIALCMPWNAIRNTKCGASSRLVYKHTRWMDIKLFIGMNTFKPAYTAH